jgi:hypothetical protein
VIARVWAKLRHFLQQTTSKLVRSTGLPAVAVGETEAVLGQMPPENVNSGQGGNADASSVQSAIADTSRQQAADELQHSLASNFKDTGRPTDMNASVDTLAEQMLTLVEIVSAQEKDIKALKDQCRKLEEHDQAIAVAFSTFFHVLSAGRVAKLGEIANILNHIIRIAEQEGRPPEAIRFLRDLASMLPDDQP